MGWQQINYTDSSAPQQLADAFQSIGFGVLTQVPIQVDLIQQVYQEWADFFTSDQKQHYRFDPAVQSGYFPFRSETAKDNTIADLKEFFHLYEWTALPDGMSDRTWVLFRQLRSLAAELLEWLERHLPDHLQQQLSQPLSQMVQDSPQTLLRPIHYPPLPEQMGGAVRAAAHEDINLITLLPAATDSGLEVMDHHGVWHPVPHNPGAIIVNVGDMLQLTSQGYYRSTTHRVVNPVDATRRRFSMPLFLHPRSEVVLSGGQTAEQVLQQRLIEIGLRQT